MKKLLLLLILPLIGLGCSNATLENTETAVDNEPIVSPTATTNVRIYFPNSKKDPTFFDCSLVHPVNRVIVDTNDPTEKEKRKLEALLAGPTEEEKAEGYFTNINPGVKINYVKIDKDTVYVDFDQEFNRGMGGACRVNSISYQIYNTVKKPPEIIYVKISVDGETENVLQP